ncbi:MAG: hypothetical protein OEX76_05705 [Candidatus Bathyarchaeota archaeon]|nr:hypothetical protein [Candidatus Bathyarchaeota archaeon]MDH5532657.1 hypothetical protein [Candidatus Bathyarchaeota archaeon]MDH5713213.1 hypothetical protein [Candidatus Bathyarchaeota archaeon]
MGKNSLDVRKAIICFQYTERIKSELIITANLLGKIGELESDELAGAEKLILLLLRALQGEVGMAHSILGMQNFEDAGDKVAEVAERVRSREYLEATRRISEAISLITTGGQQATEVLKEKGFL